MPIAHFEQNRASILQASDLKRLGEGIDGFDAGARGLLILTQLSARSGASAADARQAFSNAGLSAAHCATLERLWEAALHAPPPAATPPPRRLVDLEWKFGVTAATSEDTQQTGLTYLQLKLVLDRAGAAEPVFVELPLDRVYEFLAQCVKAKAAITAAV